MANLIPFKSIGILGRALMDLLRLLFAVPVIALYLLIGLLLWGLVLWNSLVPISSRPLAFAFLVSTTVLLASTAVLAVLDSSRLPFSFIFYHDFAVSMGLVTFTGVPIVALLVRFDRLGYGAATALIIFYVVITAALLGGEYFVQGLIYLAPSTGAFFITLTVLVRRQQHQEEPVSSRTKLSLQPEPLRDRDSASRK